MKKSLDIYKILHGIPKVHILFLSRELSIFITEKKEDTPMAKHVACEYRRFSSAAPRGEEQRETVVFAGYNA